MVSLQALPAAAQVVTDVFSSKSDHWEERPFVREGNAARIVAEARQDHPCRWSSAKRGAAYWQQALYVHCQPNAVMRHFLHPSSTMESKLIFAGYLFAMTSTGEYDLKCVRASDQRVQGQMDSGQSRQF
ncbi:hypothetical protein ZWY2020_001465 [Hordeum vulgare]|nr:hypothetical protein ZWY2020_001465 [Hordeum vulgare]